MASVSDFRAKGKVIEVRGEGVVFQPSGTTYEIHLKVDRDAPAPSAAAPVQATKAPIECLIRVQARKVYTVPSGGNFVAPIFGPPKTIQGRVLYADDRSIVVQGAASAPIVVDLPSADTAIDLSEGTIRVGNLVNVVALPGATFAMLE